MTATSTSNKPAVRRNVLYGVLAVLLVALDQWSKSLVLANLGSGRPVTVLPGILQFRYVQNTGAAFSVLTGKTLALSIVTAAILILAVVLLLLDKVPGRWNQIALVLMIAGGAGNLIDRIVRHYVVDFIEVLFTDFAVFNVADCCVTVGAAILILSALVSFVKESKNQKELENDD